MSTAPLHLLNVEDGIALVTLNRPAALNSINRALRMELLELFPALDLRKDVKVIVITGAGDKAFCTGADLKERSTRSTEEMVYDRHYLVSQSTSALANVSKPVIAAIKGYCMAGGFEMVLQCDISIAADNAIFSLPECTHGFFPGGGACQRLPRLVGYQLAKELIFTGRR
jgi:methylglutaconyl-CoA hydratase